MQARKPKPEEKKTLVLELNQILMHRSKSDTNISEQSLKTLTPAGRKSPISPPVSKRPSTSVQHPSNYLTSRQPVYHKLSLENHSRLESSGSTEKHESDCATVIAHPLVSKKLSTPARPASKDLASRKPVHHKLSLENWGNDKGDCMCSGAVNWTQDSLGSTTINMLAIS